MGFKKWKRGVRESNYIYMNNSSIKKIDLFNCRSSFCSCLIRRARGDAWPESRKLRAAPRGSSVRMADGAPRPCRVRAGLQLTEPGSWGHKVYLLKRSRSHPVSEQPASCRLSGGCGGWGRRPLIPAGALVQLLVWTSGRPHHNTHPPSATRAAGGRGGPFSANGRADPHTIVLGPHKSSA